jgi:hypothetical protein
MPFGVQPLVVTYSFVGARTQATDLVDLAQLDLALGMIADKVNEVIAALDVIARDDNQLDDGVLEARHLSDDGRAEFIAIANAAVDARA